MGRGQYQYKDGNEQGRRHDAHEQKDISDFILKLSGGGGGGRGKYQHCDGDMPVAKIWRNPMGIGSMSVDQIVVLSKNLSSIQSGDRWDQLMGELETLQWDVVLCQETWREYKEEIFETGAGHLFLGAGGIKGKRGVAIILHKRWRHSFLRFSVGSERVASADVRIHDMVFTFISAYFPHSDYADMCVLEVYDALESMIRMANHKKHFLVFGFDGNAVVGKIGPEEADDFVGEYGYGCRNVRGEWLARWSLLEGIVLTNTMFDLPVFNLWTYQNGGHYRQLDFVAVDLKTNHFVVQSGADDIITVGNEHRTIKTVLQMRTRPRCTRQRKTRSHNFKGWQPADPAYYKEELDTRIDSLKDTEWLSKSLEEKCKSIEAELIVMAERHRKQEELLRAKHISLSCKARTLIDERRSIRRGHGGRSMKEVSKEIQKEIRRHMRAKKREQISKILEDCKGLKHIAGIRNNGKKTWISSVRNENGELQESRDGIANAFADFYAVLYDGKEDVLPEGLKVNSCTEITPLECEEVRAQLKQMKNNKAQDCAGIVAEMLKAGGNKLLQLVTDIFNEILLGETLPPEEWKETRLKVLFKKGDQYNLENYRPISILPITLKLFSRVLYGRIKGVLGKAQSVNQAGFRSGFSCDDHLFTLTMVFEKMFEWNQDFWIVGIDFRKAFDLVLHSAIWSSLSHQGVPLPYVRTLRMLYESQVGRVMTDVESKTFRITRGTKQGDPISPPLFNAVLEEVMSKLGKKWSQRRMGIKVETDDGSFRYLQELRFADDLLLLARTRKDAMRMLEDLSAEASKVGLQIHFGKTKILSSRPGQQHSSVDLNGQRVEVLSNMESLDYLGRSICMGSFHDKEIEHRIGKAWGQFHKYKSELCCRHYPLKARLQLFDKVVTPTVLYASGCWTMTVDRESKIRVAQRRMLRKIVQTGRQREKTADDDTQPKPNFNEEWVDWIVRATREAEKYCKQAGVDDWMEAQRRRHWRWAGHVARAQDSRWSKELLHWIPRNGWRSRGRPVKRWSDELNNFLERLGFEDGVWTDLAQERDFWHNLEDDFVQR